MEGESKVGSSSEPQVTEPSSLLGKRKIETTSVKDPGDNEGVDEEDSDQDPNWDKDSFDGREYHSADDEDAFLIESLRKDTHSYRRNGDRNQGRRRLGTIWPWSSLSAGVRR